MKKSIFLFFAAILCAIGMNAADIPAGTKLYLKPNSNWSGARYAVYFYGNGDTWVSMQLVPGESNIYEVTSPNKVYKNLIFCRMDPSIATNGWDNDGNNMWNQTSDLTYDETKNLYTVKEGTWDKGGGTWSVYTPPTTETKYYVTGSSNLVGGAGWKANEIEMVLTDGKYTHTFTGLTKGETYELKVTKNGNWDDGVWGVNNLNGISYYDISGNNDNNIVLKPSQDGDLTVSFSGEIITLSGITAPKRYVTGESVVGNWNPDAKLMNYANGKHTYTKNLAAGTYTFKVTDGTWNNSWGNGSQDYEFTTTAGDVTIEFDDTNKSIKVIVPEINYYITGNTDLVGGDGWKANEIKMTETSGIYTHEFTNLAADKLYLMKITNGSWSENYGHDALKNTDAKVENYGGNIAFYLSSAGNVNVSFDLANKKITLTGSFAAIPAVRIHFVNTDGWETVYAYAWDGESKNADYPGEDITSQTDGKVNDFNVHYIEFKLGKYANVIFGCGTDECKTGDMTVADHVGKYYYSGLWYDSAIDIPTIPQYFITGNSDLVGGDGWKANEIKMTETSGIYTHEFTNLAADKLYLMKVTNGSWSENYGHDALQNTDAKVENYGGNIAFYLSSAGNVNVSFDLANKKITLTGSFTAIPTVRIHFVNTDGWEKVYAYAWDGDSKNAEYPGEDITSKTDGTVNGFNVHYVEFKLGKYANVIFGCGTDECKTGDMTVADNVGKYYYSGTWYNSANDIPNPADIKCYLMGNGDWVNGVEMEEDGAQFKLLAHHIYAPFKFKFGETWTADVENTTFEGLGSEDDGNGGTNITLPEGLYDFYFKKDTKQVYIALAGYVRNPSTTLGTICLPYGSSNYTGATFYEVVGKEAGKVYLGSVTTLTAGVPYIFESTSTTPTTIKVVYEGDKATSAGNKNGLIGTFTDETVVPSGNYILYSGAFIPADGTTNKVNAYRAYLNLNAVTGEAPQQMPGRRYIGMDVQGENVETGVEDLFTTETPVKAIENGQLIIIREGVKYNVQGQVIR